MTSPIRVGAFRGAGQRTRWRSRSPAARPSQAARGGAGAAPRPVGELEPQGLRLQRRRSTSTCSSRSPRPTPTSCRSSCARGVGNFFSNFSDAWSAVNNFLQGKVEAGFEDVDARRHQHRSSASAACSTSPRDGPRAPLRGLRPDARPLGRRRRRLHRAAAARAVDGARHGRAAARSLRHAAGAVFNGTGTQVGLTVLQIINTRANLLGATPRASTTSRSTSTPSCATPTCSGGAAWSSTATRRKRRRRRDAGRVRARAGAAAPAPAASPPASALPASRRRQRRRIAPPAR